MEKKFINTDILIYFEMPPKPLRPILPKPSPEPPKR